MTKKEYKIIMTAIIMASILVLFVFFFYVLDPKLRPVLKFQNGVDPLNIQLEKEIYKPGEMVRGYTSVCKVRKAEGSSAWILHNSKLVFFSESEIRELPKGCYPNDGELALFDIKEIPEDAIPEEHYFSGNATLTLWGNRKVETYYKTEKFIVE